MRSPYYLTPRRTVTLPLGFLTPRGVGSATLPRTLALTLALALALALALTLRRCVTVVLLLSDVGDYTGGHLEVSDP